MGKFWYLAPVYIAVILYPGDQTVDAQRSSSRYQESRSTSSGLRLKNECQQEFRQLDVDDALPCLPAGLDMLILKLDQSGPENFQKPDGKISWNEYFSPRLHANWTCRSFTFIDGKVAGADTIPDKGAIPYCEEFYQLNRDRFNSLDVNKDGYLSQGRYGGDDPSRDNAITWEDERLRRSGKYYKVKLNKQKVPKEKKKILKAKWKYKKKPSRHRRHRRNM